MRRGLERSVLQTSRSICPSLEPKVWCAYPQCVEPISFLIAMAPSFGAIGGCFSGTALGDLSKPYTMLVPLIAVICASRESLLAKKPTMGLERTEAALRLRSSTRVASLPACSYASASSTLMADREPEVAKKVLAPLFGRAGVDGTLRGSTVLEATPARVCGLKLLSCLILSRKCSLLGTSYNFFIV